MSAAKHCYKCGSENPDQAFCGACGSPLALDEFISTKVRDQVTESIRDRDVLEMDSSIKVFKQAWGWIKLIFGIAVGLLVLAGGGIIWKASDFWSSVDKAKQSVAETSKTVATISPMSPRSRSRIFQLRSIREKRRSQRPLMTPFDNLKR